MTIVCVLARAAFVDLSVSLAFGGNVLSRAYRGYPPMCPQYHPGAVHAVESWTTISRVGSRKLATGNAVIRTRLPPPFWISLPNRRIVRSLHIYMHYSFDRIEKATTTAVVPYQQGDKIH